MSSQVMFTISDTLLNASGKFALMAFFGVKIAINSPEVPPLKAIVNIAVLLGCSGLALAVMTAYIKQSEQKV
jgi:hypothetical protein